MKKIKRMTSVCMIICLLVACSGCKKSQKVNTNDNQIQQGTQTAEQKEDQEDTTEEKSYYNKEGYPICNDPITITVTGSMSSTPDWQNTLTVQYIKNHFGIDMQCNPITDDDWATKWTLMVNSNEIPDLVLNASLNNSSVKDYGSQGYLLNLANYLDIMPNFKKYLDEHPNFAATCMDENGAIYGISRDDSENLAGLYARTFINQRWLDNLNLSVPTNLDELYTVLKAFKEQDANGNGDSNDEIPMDFTGVKFYLESTLLNAFGIYTVNNSDYILQVDENNKVFMADESDNYKEYLRFLAKLYKEGIMNPEAYTATSDDISALAASDRLGFQGCWAPYVTAKADISYDKDWTAIVGLTSEYNTEKTASRSTGVYPSVVATVSADTKYPEAICRLLDYYFTDEGRLAQQYGWEGVSYDWVKHDIIDVKYPKTYQPEGYNSSEEFRYTKAIINGGFLFTGGNPIKLNALINLDYSKVPEDEFSQLQEKEGWIISLGKQLQQDGLKVVYTFPSLSYSADDATIRNTYFTDVTNYLKTAKANFVTGVWDIDKDWDKYKSDLKSAGIDSLLEIEQKYYDSFIQNMK